MNYTIKYKEPFYHLMKQEKFLWWKYWRTLDYNHDLEDMESELTKYQNK